MDDTTRLKFELANERWVDAANTFNHHMAIGMKAVDRMNEANKILFAIEQEHGVKRTQVQPQELTTTK
jgi:hypothetical protein